MKTKTVKNEYDTECMRLHQEYSHALSRLDRAVGRLDAMHKACVLLGGGGAWGEMAGREFKAAQEALAAEMDALEAARAAYLDFRGRNAGALDYCRNWPGAKDMAGSAPYRALVRACMRL